MKHPPSGGVLLGSFPVWLDRLNSERPPQSLFSVLLQIESELRTETRGDSLIQPRQGKLAKFKNYKRQRVENLSRYIE
jgi:hypothetical protein